MTFTPAPKPPKREPKARRPLPKPTQRIARTVAPKKRNAKRGGARFPHLADRKYRTWMRNNTCCVIRSVFCDISKPDCAHVRSRGAGGPDKENLVPLCRVHHEEQHQIGIETFQRKYGVDLPSVARAYWTVWQDLQQPVEADQ